MKQDLLRKLGSRLLGNCELHRAENGPLQPLSGFQHAFAQFRDPPAKLEAFVGICRVLELRRKLVELPPVRRRIRVVGVKPPLMFED